MHFLIKKQLKKIILYFLLKRAINQELEYK